MHVSYVLNIAELEEAQLAQETFQQMATYVVSILDTHVCTCETGMSKIGGEMQL